MASETLTCSYTLSKPKNKTLKVITTFLLVSLLELGQFTVKILIVLSLLFSFLSVFVYNLQIQQTDIKTGNLKQVNDIVQVSPDLKDLLHSYYFEK